MPAKFVVLVPERRTYRQGSAPTQVTPVEDKVLSALGLNFSKTLYLLARQYDWLE